MEKLNLPSNAVVTITTSKNKTVIELDFNTHPKDVEIIHSEIDNLCRHKLDKTEKFNSNFNLEYCK